MTLPNIDLVITAGGDDDGDPFVAIGWKRGPGMKAGELHLAPITAKRLMGSLAAALASLERAGFAIDEGEIKEHGTWASHKMERT